MITYKTLSDAPGSAAVEVRLDKRHVGTITQLAEGRWQYCTASGSQGEILPSLRAVQASLESE
jgi:hypothetical protein